VFLLHSQVSDLSSIRQVEYSPSAQQLTSADQLTSASAATPAAMSSRHQAPVAVATVTRDVITATPPPAYESLFPTTLSDNHS